jgi:excisionase family DNA binding protein
MQMPAAATSARSRHREPPEQLMTTSEVAALFGVHRSAVTEWANAGKVSTIRTLGGHRRFPEAEILALLAERDSRQSSAA